MITRILCLARIAWLEMLRRKDVYVLLILLGALLLALAGLNIFGLGGLTVYVKDVGFLLAWIFGWILAVHVSCRGLPQEERQGTVYALMAKPVTRGELVIGKWLGAWIAVCGATLVFYALVAGVALARGGPAAIGFVALGQAYLLHTAALAVLCAVGILFSTRLHQDAAASLAYALTLGAYLLLPRLPALMAETEGGAGVLLTAVYHLLPHLELFDLRQRVVHDWGPAEGEAAALAWLYGFVYTVFALTAAWLAYRRKRFSRENVA
jgi:ABC-type transport system involved in multi-copper enzyme maturation permease subunit